jgi:hypothetical protein
MTILGKFCVGISYFLLQETKLIYTDISGQDTISKIIKIHFK